LKFPLLNAPVDGASGDGKNAVPWLNTAGVNFAELCKLGLAVTWPLALIALMALGIFLVLLLRR
jgi:hypothetical protein